MLRVRSKSWFRVALLTLGSVSSVALATDLRGSLQGSDTLTPSPRVAPAGQRPSYWEVPNGVVAVASPRASTEFDVGLILTGDGIQESRQPVSVRIEGGRCRPGTVVVSPGTVLQVENQDVIGHSLYAIAQGTGNSAVPEELTSAHTRRQLTFSTAGVYELRDARQSSFRCWVVVGAGQGRIIPQDAAGAFTLTGLTEGEYTLHAWFEGVERGSTAVHPGGRDAQITLHLGAPGTPAANANAQPHGH